MPATTRGARRDPGETWGAGGPIVYPVSQRVAVNRVHRLIAEAIVAADEEEAERLMNRHVEENCNKIRELFPGMLDEIIDWR